VHVDLAVHLRWLLLLRMLWRMLLQFSDACHTSQQYTCLHAPSSTDTFITPVSRLLA
jgi:hypothetical protein